MDSLNKKIGMIQQKDMAGSPFFSVPAGEHFYIARLNFIQKSGRQFSLPYPHLGEISLDGDTLTILESNTMITIKGICLEKLYEYLIKHKVAFIKEADSDFDKKEGKTFIQKITIDKSQ